MDEELREMLANAMASEFENLKNLEPGSKEATAVVENITKLYRTGLEEVRNVEAYEEQVARREMDDQAHKDELEKNKRAETLAQLKAAQEKKDKQIEHGISVLGILAPLVLYRVWLTKGFRFEEKGTITSATFRSLIQKIKPTK